MMRMLRLMMVVQTPDIARFAAANGVDVVFVDLEYMGKMERQKHLNSWKSRQTVDDVTRIRHAVPDAKLLVRVNPLFEGSQTEIDDVIARGADIVMLPMFRTQDELMRFFDLVDGRTDTLPLFETADAIRLIPQIAGLDVLTQVHIGLNDLHVDLGLRFLFQPMITGILEEPCAALREYGVRFGIGGLARPSEGIVPPEKILGEHVRLGSSAAILSQSFHRNAQSVEDMRDADFGALVNKLRMIYRDFQSADGEQLERNRQAVVHRVRDVVNVIERQI